MLMKQTQLGIEKISTFLMIFLSVAGKTFKWMMT